MNYLLEVAKSEVIFVGLFSLCAIVAAVVVYGIYQHGDEA